MADLANLFTWFWVALSVKLNSTSFYDGDISLGIFITTDNEQIQIDDKQMDIS